MSSTQWVPILTLILSIPTTLLGLVFTYKQYQKARLETRLLELNIIEKENELILKLNLERTKKGIIIVEEHLPAESNKKSTKKIKSPFGIGLFTKWRESILTIILTIAIIYLIPSPFPNREYQMFVIFIGLLLLLILLIIFNRYFTHITIWKLSAISIVTFLLSLFFVFGFVYYRNTYIIKTNFGDSFNEILIGDTYNENVKQVPNFSKLSPTEVVQEYGMDNAREIWTNDSIKRSQIKILFYYVLSLESLSLISLFIVRLIFSKKSEWNKVD